MKIEDQVASIEPAKELRDLGVKQDGYFSYFQYDKWNVLLRKTSEIFDPNPYWAFNKDTLICSTYTVAEFGMMLPDSSHGEYVTIKDSGGMWVAWEIQKGLFDNGGCYIKAKTQVDAYAKMVIYLIKAGIIET